MSVPRIPWDQPLTPLAFLERSALVFADRTAVIDGDRRYTYREFADRCARLAGGLIELGVRPGDRVAVLAPNTRVMLEAHYGVPMAGGVLVAMNYRLAAGELAYIIDHSGANVLIYDNEWSDVVADLAELVEHELLAVNAGGPDRAYESLITTSAPAGVPVTDERSLISLNYTSGTTGRPKGVMYAHRGAYLQALSMAYHSGLDATSVVLWTLPMFHCNGWTYTWGITAAGGTHLCLRKVDAGEIWRLLRNEGVTHFNGAPTVLTMVAYHADAADGPPPRRVEIATGGAPPSPAILERMTELDMHVTHLYGLTETYGPATICQWQPGWDALDVGEQAKIKARQGVGTITSEETRVIDEDGDDVPADGATIGEVAIRGNNLMAGYYRDEEATERAIPDGWFRTGDLGVRHPDGYVELRDRAKDIIISGGENIASIEVEQAIASHPDVLEVAVIAHPDEKWGEIPVAYVTPQPGAPVTGDDIILHVRSRIAHFKAPKQVIFTDLPKTSTGKVQKYVLRAAVEDSGG
jgi:fatty-acyl-CoA synthase